MSFTYTQLQTAIQDFAENTETSIVSNLPIFIRSAEDRIFTLVDLELCGMYCEGGPALARSMLGAEEIDYVFHYQSNKTFSSPEALHGPDLKNLNFGHAIKQQFGEDQLTHGFL